MEYKSFDDLHRTIINNIGKIPREVDLVVGVPRSGLLAANIIALTLNLPLADFGGFLQGRVLSSGRRLAQGDSLFHRERLKVLLVDDSLQSGTQINSIRSAIEDARLPHEIIICVVYAGTDGVGKVDIVFEVISKNRVFEWNIFHHPRLINSCIDIDGFLCEDPTPEQNDDDSNYLHFLEHAKPLYAPTVPLGWLVTCRLEKYRKPTKDWLERNGISYKELIMMDLPSKEVRVSLGGHALFKSEVYTRTRASLFIESSLRQSREIAQRTRKPVFCVETMTMLTAAGESCDDPGTAAAASRQKGVWARIVGRLAGRS
jgi:orotate phosphoribosyltransferase